MRTHILLETDTASDAKHLINFLKTLPHIKSVTVEPALPKPLTAAEWIRPGRPATEEELEQLAVEMENDGRGEDSEIVFNRVKKGLKKRL